jgi:hypothetical protein
VVKGKGSSGYLIGDADRVVYAHVEYCGERERWVLTPVRPLSMSQVVEVAEIMKAQMKVVPF